MSCLSPLKGFIVGTSVTGKKKLIFAPYDTEYLDLTYNLEFIKTPYVHIPNSNLKTIHEYIDIPCGKCLACRLDKARDWATRIMLERSQYEDSCFITLTYDDFHVPRTCYAEPVNGEVIGDAYTLRRRDGQLFIKRLRKYLSSVSDNPVDIKFFGCGEYGDTTARPHYHYIILGWRPPDLEFFRFVDGNAYYTSDVLSSLWSVKEKKSFVVFTPKRHKKKVVERFVSIPLGHCIIGDVTMQSAGYVARYTTKKLYGKDSSFYESCNLEPPFLSMSLRPALGHDYFVNNLQKIFDDGCIFLSTENGGKRVPIPRYAYKLLADLDPVRYDEVIASGYLKSHRLKVNYSRLTKMPYPVILHNKLASLECRSRVLVRNKI